MATKTTKKVAAKAAPEPTETTPAAVVMMPADWTARPEHVAYSLAKRLTLASIVARDAFPDGDDEEDFDDGVQRWLTDSLKDDEREAIARFVAVIEWLDSGDDHAVYRSQLAVPDALAPKAAAWVKDKVAEAFDRAQVVDDPAPAVQPIAPTVEPDGQIALVTEPAKPAAPLKPMAFRTAEEIGAVRLSLEGTLKELEKLAKENDAAGLPGAAKIARDKALLLKTQLIPQVTAQQNLPFNEKETLPGMVARTVAGEVRSRARAALMKNVTQKKGESHKDAQQRQLEKLDEMEALIGSIAENVGALCTKFVAAAAERGIAVGKQALAADAATVAREAMQLVEFELQQGRAA
jgi:hypothetical protein